MREIAVKQESPEKGLKQFEVALTSIQEHRTIVRVTAENEEEAEGKALRWEVDDIVDTYLDEQEDRIFGTEEVGDL